MRKLMQPLALAGGLAAFAVALLPPLAPAADRLISAHMLQHLLVVLLASPLIAISGASVIARMPVLAPLFRPANAWLLFVGVFLLWHWPTVFRWAARSEAGRIFEETSILAAALPFWSVALSRDASINYGARALFVVAAAVATDLPGVIMVLSPRILCATAHEDALRFGLTPLADQQIAGMLMWVPANLAFFSIATALFARWLSDDTEPQQDSAPQTLVTS